MVVATQLRAVMALERLGKLVEELHELGCRLIGQIDGQTHERRPVKIIVARHCRWHRHKQPDRESQDEEAGARVPADPRAEKAVRNGASQYLSRIWIGGGVKKPLLGAS